MTTLPCLPTGATGLMMEALKTSLAEAHQHCPGENGTAEPGDKRIPVCLQTNMLSIPPNFLLSYPARSFNILNPPETSISAPQTNLPESQLTTWEVLNMLLRVTLMNPSYQLLIPNLSSQSQPPVPPAVPTSKDDDTGSANLLRELLSGADLVKVRKRSGLIDPYFGAKTTTTAPRPIALKADTSSGLNDSTDFDCCSLANPIRPSERTSSGQLEIEKPNTTEETSLLAELISRPDSPLSSGPDSIRRPSSLRTDTSSSSMVTCDTASRNRIFEWLRQTDSFVAEHSCGIPLGALMATAINPGMDALDGVSSMVNGFRSSTPVPASARHVLNKIWHQLLLLSIMEHTFVPTVTTRSVPSNELHREPWLRSNLPIRHRFLNAISSLVELDQGECPLPDVSVVHNLTSLVNMSNQLNLNRELYKLMRYCILAQAAYPKHFATSYDESMVALELCLCSIPRAPSLTAVLKLLNRLHCFDAGTLKLFFCLSTDCYTLDEATAADEVGCDVVCSTPLTGCKRKAAMQFAGPIRCRAHTTSFAKSTRLEQYARPRSGTVPTGCRTYSKHKTRTR